MYRFLYSLYIAFVPITSALAQNSSAEQVIARFRAKMEQQAAVEMRFSFSGTDGRGREFKPLQGVIYRQQDDYALVNPDVEIYVQGNTKWIYTPGNNEAVVMRYNPASFDLAENPLALFSAQFSQEYTLTGNPNVFVQEGNEVIEITLTPTGKNMPYTSILLRFLSQSLTPHSVKYMAKDGGGYEAVITSYTPRKQPFPPDRFIFSTTAHPGVYVTDLR